MRIYRKIDKTVKMHTAAIKVYILVVFSQFPAYKHHFRKFWCFFFSLTKKKTRENSAVLRCAKKKLQNLASVHSNRSETSLEHRPKILLPWKRQFSSRCWAMASKGLEMWQKIELSASVETLFSGVYYRWLLLGSWLSCNAARSKSPNRKGQGKNIPIQT